MDEPFIPQPVRTRRTRWVMLICFALTFGLAVEILGPEKIVTIPTQSTESTVAEVATEVPTTAVAIVPAPESTTITHQSTPPTVRGIYLTGWKAGTTSGMNRIMELIDGGVINTVVIDIKDATGRLSYQPKDPYLISTGVGTKRIANLPSLIKRLHDKGIYVVGRVSVFQDPYFAQLHPQETLIDTRTGSTWTDYKGIAWLRPDSTKVWDYTAAIGRDAYAQGFDEINLDYVRFPSDGALKFIDTSTFAQNKADTIALFFKGMDERLRAEGIPVSADIFGLTMSAQDDLGIGQKVALIAPYVDAVAPMVYPSHFWNDTYGIAVPAKEPYKVIHKSLSDGIAKLAAVGIDKGKLRPWFQDFDLVGVDYDASMVRAQIQAATDLGITSWMFWDPRSVYTKEVFTIDTER